MAANAPYYQMRSGQFTTTPNSANAAPSHFVHDDAEYELSPAPVTASHLHTPTSYTEHAGGQNAADISVNTMEENHNLAELLEAATTAAGQAAQAMDVHAVDHTITHDRSKRKRAPSSPVDDSAVVSEADRPIAPKRRRIDAPTDPQLQNTDTGLHSNTESSNLPQPGESLLNDARAAGVHSAAALFRRFSEKTARKYTRPPMSKLFMSLQLSPENFLQLQAKAKTYMLDTACPERQNCVGNRGKGDTDMVKLRLFNCVREFLNNGVGEEFFGENVEKPGERDNIEAARALGEDKAPSAEGRLTWPRDGNKIISLVTPLMRRMVTNERQRMYAIETRKGGSKKKDKEGSAEAVAQQNQRSPSVNHSRGTSIEQQLLPAFDHSIARSHTSQPASPSIVTPITSSQTFAADVAQANGESENELQDRTDLPLPADGPAASNITNINIFLVLASNTSSDGSVKLDQKRISSVKPGGLVSYPWDSFLSEVIMLLERAKAKYPAIRENLVQQERRFIPPPPVGGTPTLTDSLRNMAAAANAMQGESAATGGDAQAKKAALSSTSPNAINSTRASLNQSDVEVTQLPRYTIKTIGTNGWEVIQDAEQWKDLLLRRGQEVWADGIANMIVELVDIPVPSQKAVDGDSSTVGEHRGRV